MDSNEAGPSKPLTLKIRIPAFKRTQRPPTPSPPPPADDDESDDSQSASPISIDEKPTISISRITLSTTAATPTVQPTPPKPKKKGKTKSKLFARVTASAKTTTSPITHIKKPPKLKSLSELLPRLLARIKKKDHYGIFLEPVDTKIFPHYTTIIKFPMDLKTMEQNIESRQYRSLEQFSSDFRLMVKNCQTFNPAPSLYHTEATRLETFGNDIISQAAGQLAEPQSGDDDSPTTDVKMEIDLPPVIETKPARAPEPPVAARKRSESTTTNTAITAGIPATPTTSASTAISFAHSEWQKQFQPTQAQKTWVRGPYKKTIAREAPGIGPEGELPGASSGIGEFPVDSDWGKIALALELRGKRYRTKKEKMEIERRGQPTLWDGSIDYASLEEPFSVLQKFTSEPFEAPFLHALTQPSDSALRNFGTATTAEKLSERTDELAAKNDAQLPPFFVQNGYAPSRRTAAAETDPLEEPQPQYALPERPPLPADFGVFPTLGPSSREKIVAQEVARYADVEKQAAASAEENVKYVRDVVYGGVDGLAYTRSVMDFVHGAKPQKETESDSDAEYDEPPGGLGMSLQDYIAKHFLSPATDGMHEVLLEATKQLRVSTPDPSESDLMVASLIDESRNAHPLLRERITTAVQLRKDKIHLSTLVKDESDLRAGDEMWDPERATDGGEAAPAPPKFSPRWADRALKMAAERVVTLASKDKVEPAGEEEDLEQRALRFNLLALARFVPLSEGVQL